MSRYAVVKVAKSWVGYEFHPGEPAQCANFVRAVFKEAGVPLASAKLPSDHHLIPGEPIAASYADSFAGDDVGVNVSRDQLQPGDIVMWRNTYGSWPVGVITHVGIYVGNGQCVHRSTSSKPVSQIDLDTFYLQECRAPLAFKAAAENKEAAPAGGDSKLKVYWDQGKLTLVVSGSPLLPGHYSVETSRDFPLVMIAC